MRLNWLIQGTGGVKSRSLHYFAVVRGKVCQLLGAAIEGDALAGSAGDQNRVVEFRDEPVAADQSSDRVAVGSRQGPAFLIPLWLKRADQLLLGFLLAALVLLLIAFRWKLSGGGQQEIEIVSQHPREFYYSIEINRASWVEWAQLDGIGEKLARRIVKEREDHGPFRTIDELARVRGLGLKFIDKLKPFLKCENAEPPIPVEHAASAKAPR